jgi:uracil-DNA glycosylase family 4
MSRKKKTCTSTSCPLIGRDIEVPYRGPKNAKVVWIGESPGKDEELEGKCWVGDAGKLSRKVVTKVGLNWNRLFKMNSARCRIIKDNLSGKQITAILKQCRPKVEKAIHYLKPKCIIVAGDFALKQILKKGGITKARGIWVYSKEFNCWVLPTFHPAYILRNMSLKKVLEGDLRSVVDFIRNGYEPPSDEEDVDYKEVSSLKPILDAGLPVGVDTEGQGIDWADPNYICISISVSTAPGVGVNLRLYEECEPDDNADMIIMWNRLIEGQKKKQMVPVGVRRVANFNKKLDQVIELMGRADIKKYMFNGNFDVLVLRTIVRRERGIEMKVRGYAMDVQAGVHVLDENVYKMASLDFVQKMLTSVKSDYNREFAERWDKADMLAVPTEDLNRYACADADITRQSAFVVRSMLMSPGNERLANYMVKMVQPTLATMAEMQENGVWINTKMMPKVTTAVTRLVREYQEAALKAIPARIRNLPLHQKKGLKLSRADLVRDALFDGFRCRILKTTKSGAASIDKEVRIRLKDGRLSGNAREFIEDYERWSEYNTLLTRYLHGFAKAIKGDGRIHANNSLTSAVTGRMASSKPNMMNNPKRSVSAKLIRALIAAPKGWRFLAADQGQSELRWCADIANDPTMIQIFSNSNLDIHTETAKSLSDKNWANLSADEIDSERRNAKCINFGLIFGMKINGFIKYAKIEYGIDLTWDQAQGWVDIFFGKYNRIPAYHERIIESCRENGYVESPLGRRRRLPEIYSTDKWLRLEAERQAINQPIQSPSSDAVLIAGNEMRRKGYLNPDEIKLVLFVHDELIFQVRDNSKLEDYAKMIKHEMENPPLKRDYGFELKVPLVSDVKQGRNLAKMEEMKLN